MCKLYQPYGLEKNPKNNKRRAFNKGLEKNAKSITVGPTSIPDSRVISLISIVSVFSNQCNYVV